MNSIWSDTADISGFSTLKGDKKTDVLIIGGGMAGVLCAYYLQKAGINYILTEGNKIGSGITKNTTAKITSQHGLIYHNHCYYKFHPSSHTYLSSKKIVLFYCELNQ